MDLARRIPGPLGAIAAQGHAAAALALIDAFGGTKIKLPAKAEGSNVAERIGLSAAAALITAATAPCNLRIPSKTCLAERRAAAVLDAIAAGRSNTDIARSLGVSDTYVSRLRRDSGHKPASSRRDERQLDLF
jgi:ATP/maltotriose-dependent transcriptional regulator MalT